MTVVSGSSKTLLQHLYNLQEQVWNRNPSSATIKAIRSLCRDHVLMDILLKVEVCIWTCESFGLDDPRWNELDERIQSYLVGK